MSNFINKKTLFFERFNYLFSEYSRIVLVNIENICSNQLKKCRKALGEDSILILGKNKIIKKVLKEHIKKKPDLAKLIPYLSGNIGFIFTKLKPLSLKNILYENKVPAPAKSGQKAPNDVEIPSGITTLTPDGTSFFQALNIQTKIAKGFIEIVNPVKIITKNQIIGNSEVILLQKLNIVPFSHQIKIKLIYENECCIDPEILEISMDHIQNIYSEKKFELTMLETFSPFSNSFGLDFQRKSTIIKLLYLAKRLGYSLQTKQSVNSENSTKEIFENSDANKKTSSEEKVDSENEDLGLNLFD